MTGKGKIEKIKAEIERLLHYYCDEERAVETLNDLKCFTNTLQKEPVSIWHDASERAEKGRLYLYRTNQNVVGINRSEGKDFPDYCERWAYIDDLFKL